jgi:hypothetical protein
MSKKTTTLLILLWMGLFGTVQGQKMLLKAEEMAESGSSKNAILTFEKYLKENPNDYVAMGKLARVYSSNGQFGQAIFWYNSVPADATMSSDFYVDFGSTLKRVGRYSEAMDAFGKLAVVDPLLGDEMIASTQFAIEALSNKAGYDLELLPCNSNSSDFGLTFYKNIPVFTSFRNDVLMDETQQKFNANESSQKSYTYLAGKNKLTFVNGQNGQINRVGPLSFTGDGLSCALIDAKLEDNLTFDFDNSTATLYLAKLNGSGEITSSKPFEHNEVISSINSACLAFDGSALYFSSNRAGGFGGFDIYVSYLEDGRWTMPANLGETINTSGNEITPFLSNNDLYFSTDRGNTLGGFDIFKSSVDAGSWTKAVNMGNGVNSIADDYFPVMNYKNELFVTTNRLGGRGKHDIYKAVMGVQPQEVAYADMPKAVNLEELEKNVALHSESVTQDVTLVSNREKNPIIVGAKTATNEPKQSSITTTGASIPTGNLEDKKNTNSTLANKIEDKKATKPAEQKSTKLATVENTTGVRLESKTATEMSMVGVHRVGLEKAIPRAEVFFIQLASMSMSKPNFTRFKSLVKFGNIYKMINNRSIKVRLGYFDNKSEAEGVLSKVKASGYADAFITFEVLNTAQMELILASTDEKYFADQGNFNVKNSDPGVKDFKNGSKYKIRLASYEDPTWFDLDKVKDLGRVEQWTKGSWTIFVLAGYNNIEEAKAAVISANNRGFKTAEVVIDNGGILERLKQN